MKKNYFGMIQVSVKEKISLGSEHFKETNESTLGKESDLESTKCTLFCLSLTSSIVLPLPNCYLSWRQLQ